MRGINISKFAPDSREGIGAYWYAIAALRGPDCDREWARVMKRYTTARLRSLLLQDMRIDYVKVNDVPLAGMDFLVRNAFECAADPHFWAHWQYGVVAAGLLTKYDLFTETVLKSSRKETPERFCIFNEHDGAYWEFSERPIDIIGAQRFYMRFQAVPIGPVGYKATSSPKYSFDIGKWLVPGHVIIPKYIPKELGHIETFMRCIAK